MRKLTDIEVRCLKLLSERTDPIGPGYLGTLLWPEKNRATWAYARPAGKVLNGLRKLGLVEWMTYGGIFRRDGWLITLHGRAAVVECG